MASPDSLRTAIELVHQAIADHTDPQAKQTLTVCLQNMLKVQAQDYQRHQDAQQPSAQQAVLSTLGAAG